MIKILYRSSSLNAGNKLINVIVLISRMKENGNYMKSKNRKMHYVSITGCKYYLYRAAENIEKLQIKTEKHTVSKLHYVELWAK